MIKNYFLLLLTVLNLSILAQPTISSLAPNAGDVGSAVIITGTNFDASTSNNVVYFGATKALITAASATSLTVTVPVGATFDYVSVTNLTTSLTAYSLNEFDVTTPCVSTTNQASYAPKADFVRGSISGTMAGCYDFDGDGKTDVVAEGFPPFGGRVLNISRNTSTPGSVSFDTNVDFSIGNDPRDMRVMDFDGDGKLDIAVSNGNNANVSVLRNTSTVGTISFAPRVNFTSGQVYSMTCGDLDGDGKPEIVAMNMGPSTISVLRNTSTLGSISFAPLVSYATTGQPEGGAIGDVDGDGKPEVIAITGQSTYRINIYRNTCTPGTISLAPSVTFLMTSIGSHPDVASIGDLDGDGKTDIVVAAGFTPNISVRRNTSTIGTITMAAQQNFAAIYNVTSTEIGDLNGDGKPDLIAVSSSKDTLSLFENASTPGNIAFSPRVDLFGMGDANTASIGDIDGDDRPDITIAGKAGSTFSVIRKRTDPIMSSTNAINICSAVTAKIPLTANATCTYNWIATDNPNITGESTSMQPTDSLINTLTNSSSSVQNVTYTVTPTSLAGCVGEPQIVTISVNPKPFMISPNTLTVCNNTTFGVNLLSNAPSTFTWVAANNPNTIGESTLLQSTAILGDIITNNVTTVQKVIYTVTPTYTAGGCVGTTQTFTLSVFPDPIMTNASSIAVCSGSNVNLGLSSNVGAFYEWSALDNPLVSGESLLSQSSNTLNDILTNLSGSAQTVMYDITPTTYIGSCPGITQTLTVTINTLPLVVANATANAICAGNSVTLTGVGASNYTWSSGAFNGIPFNPSTNVNYTVTGTDVNGCKNTDTVSVNVNPLPTVNITASSTTVCSGAGVTLTGSGNATSYSWSGGINDGATFFPTASSAYVVTGTDANGCQKTASVNVTVNQLPSVLAIATANPLCLGSSVVLFGSGASSYTWTGGVFNGISFTPTSSITYTLTGTDFNSCVSTDTITVAVNQPPSISIIASSTLVCPGGLITLSGSGANTYSWSGGIFDGVPFNASGSQTYTVTGTDVNSCNGTASVIVNTPLAPVPNICLVTTDSTATSNIIFWEKSLYASADSFVVYRFDAGTGSYLKIGAVSTDSSQFMDTKRNIGGPNGGDPSYSSWRYKLAIRDTCGNLSLQSPYHQSIFVQESGQNFSWNAYGVEAGQINPANGAYSFSRDDNNTGNWVVLVTTIGLATTDPNYALYPNANWRVDALGFNCSPVVVNHNNNSTQSVIVKSRSNIRNNRVNGIKQLSANMVSVHPNPTSGLLTVQLDMIMEKATIEIYNVIGEKVASELLSGQQNQVDISNLTAGMYQLFIVEKGVNVFHTKVVKQ